jgi:cytochrome b561
MQAHDSKSAAGARYTRTQIVLHWAVVGLVVVQWLSHDAMEDFWDLVEDGEAAGLPDDPIALLHMASGASILVLMLIRLAVRLRLGAPPLPADMPAVLRLAAHLNHFAFYAILILLPLSGTTAIFLGVEDAADLHGALVPLLFLLIAAHLGGVAYHTFIRRDGLIWRMLRPG